MGTYIANTPIKTMPNAETKEIVVVPEGGSLELSDTEAAELLAIKAVSGPVDAKKGK
ncbi:hypothetical protein [Rhodocyclus tenuis]|uniref:Uncharacterized protein n=1 Tax=Rhodocyclus tenuis TaxID=1066 RepID=A0A840GDC2_RHOTE|nr:hypothetical protein [Rhodocyclus tenuis]MBB4246552.1 hypothetical protein [Rhodocyclus tenuis]